MNTNTKALQETLAGLQPLVEGAELRRDDSSVEVLNKYLSLHIADLLPLTQTLSEGVFEQLIHYMGSGDEEAKTLLRQQYQALWEIFLRENRSGMVGLLLAKEIVLSYMMLEFATAKLVRFFPYAGSKEGRLMESLQSRYLKSLKMFQKLNGKLPPMAVHLTQINVETLSKGQQAYGEYASQL